MKVQEDSCSGENSVRLLAVLRENFHVAIAARVDLEVTCIGLTTVTSDNAVQTLSERHRGEGADRFLHDIAARRQHAPSRVRQRLSPRRLDELQGYRRRPVAQR